MHAIITGRGGSTRDTHVYRSARMGCTWRALPTAKTVERNKGELELGYSSAGSGAWLAHAFPHGQEPVYEDSFGVCMLVGRWARLPCGGAGAPPWHPVRPGGRWHYEFRSPGWVRLATRRSTMSVLPGWWPNLLAAWPKG